MRILCINKVCLYTVKYTIYFAGNIPKYHSKFPFSANITRKKYKEEFSWPSVNAKVLFSVKMTRITSPDFGQLYEFNSQSKNQSIFYQLRKYILENKLTAFAD